MGVGWIFVYEDIGDRMGNCWAVEAKLTMDQGPGRKVWVDARATHQFEGEEELRE